MEDACGCLGKDEVGERRVHCYGGAQYAGTLDWGQYQTLASDDISIWCAMRKVKTSDRLHAVMIIVPMPRRYLPRRVLIDRRADYDAWMGRHHDADVFAASGLL
jgi:hypothetical protein